MREPWQPQCPAMGYDNEQCEKEEGHEGLHRSENQTWGTIYSPDFWERRKDTIKPWEDSNG